MKNKKAIGILIILSFLISFLTPFVDLSGLKARNVNATPKTSTDCLFNGKMYTFNLDDFYDDENLYKTYTGAKFQTEAENETTREWSGVVNNDTVTPVNNTETQYGDPSNINMINGTTDSADNMRVNDDTSTNFTSTHTDGYIYETPSQWDNFTFIKGSGGATGELETDNDANYAIIDSSVYVAPTWRYITACTMNYGSCSGTIANAQYDDTVYFTLTAAWYGLMDGYYLRTNHLGFNIAPDGSAQYVSYDLDSSDPNAKIFVNDGLWKEGSPDLDANDQYHAGVNSVYFTAFHTSSFTIRVYYFRMDSVVFANAELDVSATWAIPDSIQNFYYDYRTTVSVDCDLDIYNWDTTGWLELESNTGTGFITGSYGLTDPYINGSNYVKIRFQTAEYAGDFDLVLDQLSVSYRVDDGAELEFTITFTFANYNEDLLAMTIQSWQRTNISQTINFSIWNYDTGDYVQISSSSDTSFTEKEYNTTSPTDFISSSGVVKLYWVGLNMTNDFELHIDYLFVRIYYKLDLVHSKLFDINGIYRYRWEITGSIHYTQWVIFEVVDPVPNFHAISESDVTTRWILQNATLTPVEDFQDDISGTNWDLYGVSDRVIDTNYIPTDDAFVSDIIPWGNYGTSNILTIKYSHLGEDCNSFIKWEYPYLDLNYTTDSELYLNGQLNTDGYVKIYLTTDFKESTITWNNQPASGTYQTDFAGFLGYQTITLGDPSFYYKFVSYTDVSPRLFTCCSSEGNYRPYIRHHFSKNYLGGGYMYMQTNITEAITLQSTVYGTNYTLSSGDYFEVDFQTSSDSKINLILLKDGAVNKTLTLSQSGNTNFNNQTVQIPVDEFVEFDQLKISSTFEDTDYVKVYDIKTYKYTITGDYKDFYVAPDGWRDVYLTPGTYNLRIWEYGDPNIKLNEDIIIGSTDVYKIYTPTEKQACRLTLYSTSEPTVPLIFDNYHVSVNRSLNGQYWQIDLVEPVFYVDVGTTIDFNVYDRFDNLINAFEDKLADSYIVLDLDVYQLEIINRMTQKTTININESYYFEIASTRWINFMLSKRYYQIGYYNPNNIYTQFIIYLDSNQVYELNMSRICNLYYTNQQMEPLSFYQFKTYINGTRIINNMFYATDGEHKGIEVKDLSDISVLNHTYVEGTEELNQISLILTMYSLKVMSLQLVFNHINITRDPNYYESSYYWSEWLAPRETAEYFLFPGYYVINITNYEDGGWSKYDYTLNGDDYILIGSNNTIYNVLVNIANVNTTISNQITNVEINITNQNSNINNTIVSIEINLDNINSTLGSILLDIDTAISNINSSIISEIVSLSTELTNINSSITNEILSVSADLTNVNSSVISQLLTLGVDISNINGSIINQIIDLGVDVSNINTSLSNQILSIGVDISNLDTSITNQITSVISNITNINTTLSTQITSLSSDIININSSIVNQIIDLGVDITNINTSLSNQILSLEVDISNLDTLIIEQILLVIADIENIETVIDDQTLVILSDITNVNSTLLNQMVVLGVDITNINASITNQILDLSVDLTNINSSISNLLTNINISISNLENDIGTFYAFTNTSFINLNNVMNTSFINIENNIFSINQTISNLVIGVSNDIYLINGTISTMITQLETNLLLMNVSINTALFDLDTTLDLIGSNITSNYILLNNSIYLNSLNINDSRIAIINNLLLVNNTISTLISEVYSAVYLINNSIYTAVVDLGTYLSIMNNTISGNLSIILEMNDFLTEIYKMTMFSDLLNWTNIGLNTSLITTQIDVWTFINNYVNQSVEVHLRYQDLIEKLVISADDFRDQWLPNEDVEYNLWSVRDKKYVDEWKELDPDNKTVPFGFYEEEVPEYPSFENTSITITLIILIFIGVVGFTTYFVYRYNKRVQNLKVVYARQYTMDKDLIKGAVRPRSSRMKKIK